MANNSKVNVKKVKYGKDYRYKFGNIDEVLDIPYLVEVQKDSFNNFITKGIRDVLRDFSPIFRVFCCNFVNLEVSSPFC